VLSARQRSSVGCTDTEVAAFALDGDSELWKKSIRRTRFPVVKLDAVDDAGIFFDGGGSLIRFDLQTGGLIGRLPSANQQIQQPGAIPIVSADGQHLLFASRRRVKGKLPILRIDRRETDSDQLSRLPPTLELPRRDVEEVRNNKDLGLAKKIVKVALPDFGRKISALTLNDDGLLFFSNESGGLYVYDWTNGFVLDEVAIESNESIAALAICGKWLAVGHQRGGIMLYEIHESGSLRLHGSVFGHDKAVVGIESMPLVNETERDAGTANSIASLSKDGRLRVWEIPTFGNLMNVEALREPPKGLVVVDDTTILVASASRLATVNPKTQNVSVAVGRRVGPRVAVSADGKRLAFVKGKSITIAKAKTGVTEEPFAFEENPIAVQFTPDSKFLLVGFSKRFALVNFRSGKTVETVDVEVRSLGGLEALFAISPKRTLMASVSKQGQEIVIVPAEK
jgi:WD40 repeat protein